MAARDNPRFTLLQGDCLNVLEEITDLIPDHSVDMIFADPPYNLSNDGFTCQGVPEVSQKPDAQEQLWDEINGILKAGR